jgi:2-(1,2-epoxy-1,2-dihydrophenyl)acetyl-CoA isomerase
MEGLVKIIEDYHRHRKHLFEKLKSKPQFAPKVFLKGGVMKYKAIELIVEEGIAFLYLNRPKVLNALNETMKDELIHALKETGEDDNVRVMILTGRGRSFCAGADLNRFIEIQESDREHKKKSKFGSIDFPRAFIQYPKPMIAAINGPAYGFGFTVTLTCDIRLASERAEFSCAFVRIGVTPEFCSTYFLPRLIGYGKAAELIFTARPFDAHEALEIGAINQVFPHNRLMPEARKIAKQIASMPPTAVQKSKEILRHGIQSTLDQVIQHEAMVFLDAMKTEEHRLALSKLLAQMKFRNVRTHRSKK